MSRAFAPLAATAFFVSGRGPKWGKVPPAASAAVKKRAGLAGQEGPRGQQCGALFGAGALNGAVFV